MHNNMNVNVSGPVQPTSTYKTKVLKGNQSFASQVTEPNMKYVIKHDFVLDGDVTIPANCVLQFDGGSISGDGTGKETITGGQDMIIKSNSKCFDNIKFAGNCRENHFHTKWFTTPSAYRDLSYNHTRELQQMLDCGAWSFVFDNGFYYVTNTLTITGSIDLYTECNNKTIQILEDSTLCPIIYSDKVVTIIQYNFSSGTPFRDKRAMHIGAIHVICEKPFTDVTAESITIPIVKIDFLSHVWGSDISMLIKGARNSVTKNGTTALDYNYTGLAFESHSSPATMIHFYGVIIDTYLAYSIKKDSSWVSGFELLGDTQCVKGIDITQDILSTVIGGQHQTCSTLELFGNDAYFYSSGSGFVNKTSIIWDYGLDAPSGLTKVTHGFLVTGSVEMAQGHSEKIFWGSKYFNSTERQVPGTLIPYYKRADACMNNFLSIIPTADTDVIASNGIIREYHYKINNTLIENFTDGTIYNIDKLFPKDIKIQAGSIDYVSKGEECAFILFDNANMLTSIELYLYIPDVYLDRFGVTNDIIYKTPGEGDSSCVLSILNNREVVETINMDTDKNGGFFRRVPVNYIINKYNSGLELKFNVTFSSSIKKQPLPFFGITCWKDIREVNSLGSTFRKPNILSNTRKGFNYYDETFKKQIYWNGRRYIDEKGFSAALSFGNTESRPKGTGLGGTLIPVSDVGFKYFDTTLIKEIYASKIWSDGNVVWNEMDGAEAGVARNGTTSERPAGGSIYIGFKYFDTTLNKPIFASAINGSAVTWVDATGATV